jgi:hypothetical protein
MPDSSASSAGDATRSRIVSFTLRTFIIWGPSTNGRQSMPVYRLVYSHGIARRRSMRGNIKRLGLYGEDLSRLVRRSREAAFALRATARPLYEGRALARRRRGEGGRDSVKVAQYEVLGYSRQVPAGLILSNHRRTCAVLIRALMLPVRSHRLCRLPILNAFDASLRDR